jgi:hypothetical protein
LVLNGPLAINCVSIPLYCEKDPTFLYHTFADQAFPKATLGKVHDVEPSRTIPFPLVFLAIVPAERVAFFPFPDSSFQVPEPEYVEALKSRTGAAISIYYVIL